MKSAFGVEHQAISKKSEKRQRAEHYGRMAGALGTVGAATGAVGAGSGIVGAAERKGKDPMGFTARNTYDQKPLKGAARARVLKPVAAAHGYQAKTLGGISAVSLGLAGAYKHKKKKELSKAERRKKSPSPLKRKASDVALGAGSAGVGAVALKEGGRHAHMLNAQAKNAETDARISHHVLAGDKLKAWEMEPADKKFNQSARKLGARVSAVKRTGALGATIAGAAGGAGLYELGRHGTRKLRKKRP